MRLTAPADTKSKMANNKGDRVILPLVRALKYSTWAKKSVFMEYEYNMVLCTIYFVRPN